MAMLEEVIVEGVVFPPVVRPPGSNRTHFLAGAGVRGLEIDGNFVKFAAIGIYLEDAAVLALSSKWSGKTADELAADAAFFRDIYTGEFEKFTRVTFIGRPLDAKDFAGKVMESRVEYLKSACTYTDAEAAAVDEFKAVFKGQTLPPGASALFTHSPAGVITVAVSEDSSVPETGARAAIENKVLCEAVMESIIGERIVSPATKLSIATRARELLNRA
ncbi:hypothetical protein PR202_ga11488 [Eleusine coracana subsp. coracana]|uniref:Chalcone-flavonone isomerase family protein n=1 Tax=Eleusine coracana subsp. coracana TaxID=191504 RepID=A0AAV5C9Q1_ELECO|nr:hypothetical protein PR202_ga11488 [Eleusine coracana subsp. coracana]